MCLRASFIMTASLTLSGRVHTMLSHLIAVVCLCGLLAVRGLNANTDGKLRSSITLPTSDYSAAKYSKCSSTMAGEQGIYHVAAC